MGGRSPDMRLPSTGRLATEDDMATHGYVLLILLLVWMEDAGKRPPHGQSLRGTSEATASTVCWRLRPADFGIRGRSLAPEPRHHRSMVRKGPPAGRMIRVQNGRAGGVSAVAVVKW